MLDTSYMYKMDNRIPSYSPRAPTNSPVSMNEKNCATLYSQPFRLQGSDKEYLMYFMQSKYSRSPSILVDDDNGVHFKATLRKSLKQANEYPSIYQRYSLHRTAREQNTRCSFLCMPPFGSGASSYKNDANCSVRLPCLDSSSKQSSRSVASSHTIDAERYVATEDATGMATDTYNASIGFDSRKIPAIASNTRTGLKPIPDITPYVPRLSVDTRTRANTYSYNSPDTSKASTKAYLCGAVPNKTEYGSVMAKERQARMAGMICVDGRNDYGQRMPRLTPWEDGQVCGPQGQVNVEDNDTSMEGIRRQRISKRMEHLKRTILGK